MSPLPLWRWWLFCAAHSLWWRFEWQWCADVYAWAVLPSWLGHDDEGRADPAEAPF